MSPQQVFSIVNAVALLAWIMLAVLPGRPWVAKRITTKVVPSLFAVLYTAIGYERETLHNGRQLVPLSPGSVRFWRKIQQASSAESAGMI
jgi:hypothetical protein